VPLAPAAITILKSAPRRARPDNATDHIFGGGKGGYSGWSKAKVALDRRICEARAKRGFRRITDNVPMTYGFVVLPTRGGQPRDQAKVEVALLFVERWVLAHLRNRRFFSLEELNTAIRDAIAELNNRVMRKLGKSRRELFETLDRPALTSLPHEPYRYAEWKRCRVVPDYHVEVDDHY
jgi:hypothetical protein